MIGEHVTLTCNCAIMHCDHCWVRFVTDVSSQLGVVFKSTINGFCSLFSLSWIKESVVFNN